MNEAETRAELIDPALREAGWGVVEGSRVRREAIITNGRILGKGMREPRDIADYVLFYKGKQLAVIEAKRRDLPDTEGVGQAKKYAKTLQARFAYSTNGAGIYQIDMQTGEEKYVDCYLSPEQLWAMTFAETNEWRDRFGKIPFETKSGTWQVRYYQHNAIDKALEAIAAGKKRVLLTLATGTGKTAIAFQIAWKLFHSRWNLSGKPTRLPRILFLADRNILANQAKNAFSAFPDDALTRISPEEIRRKGRVPKNASLFFTIFQTFMTGADEEGNPAPYFGEYPSDFFDFIVIDECHRGGANDESSWRAIMEHFTSAVQLGLTATPKRIDNIDTYSYFGDPVYIYSLKEGINDGFLTPFRLKKVSTTLDEYVYTPDDDVIEGDIDESNQVATASKLPGSVNTEFHESTALLSADGNTLYFTRNNFTKDTYKADSNNTNRLKLYKAQRNGDGFNNVEELPFNDNGFSTAHPALSVDGKTLYFVRGIFTGRGIQNQDIYVSTLGSNGIWSKPEKLSPKINTPGREESVFIHPDGKTLYFSLQFTEISFHRKIRGFTTLNQR